MDGPSQHVQIASELIGLGISPRYIVMYPTLNNELFHARRDNGLIPLLASEGPERSLIFPLGNHCVFIRSPLCGFQNRYR